MYKREFSSLTRNPKILTVPKAQKLDRLDAWRICLVPKQVIEGDQGISPRHGFLQRKITDQNKKVLFNWESRTRSNSVEVITIQVLASNAPFAIFINVLSCVGIKLYCAGESVNL